MPIAQRANALRELLHRPVLLRQHLEVVQQAHRPLVAGGIRILEAFVDAEWLAELDARLAAYRAELDGREEADREQ